jgi:hypothetical protein
MSNGAASSLTVAGPTNSRSRTFRRVELDKFIAPITTYTIGRRRTAQFAGSHLALVRYFGDRPAHGREPANAQALRVSLGALRKRALPSLGDTATVADLERVDWRELRQTGVVLQQIGIIYVGRCRRSSARFSGPSPIHSV